MVESGEIHKIELFTYDREIERYGGSDSMELIESLFMVDSQLILRMSKLLLDYGDEIRWRLTLLVTDNLLNLFQYSNSEKLTLITSLRAAFGNEFNESGILRKQLGSRYREIESILTDDFSKFQIGTDKGLSDSQIAIFSLVQIFLQDARPYVEKINSMFASENGLNASRDSLLSSILHMHNNRMFKAYGREQELVMHDFLRRFYFSKEKTQLI
jgi:thiopeptide-type bacteriocin biosynthesis protein